MASISVTIGGIDYTSSAEQGTFAINQVLTRRGDTATFSLVSTTALTNLLPFPRVAPVTIRDAYGNTKFGGLLTDVVAHADRGPGVYVYECHCQDYAFPLAKTLGNKKYANQTIDAIARDLIATYMSATITTNNVQSGLPTVQYFNVNHLRLSDALDKLVRMASGVPIVWEVDQYLDLHMADTLHVPAADAALVDTPTVLQTYPSVVLATGGLVGYWPMADNTALLFAAKGSSGQYSGGYTQLQAGPVTAGYGVQFGGVNGTASMTPSGLGTTGMSLECWVLLNASVAGSTAQIFGCQTSNNIGNFFLSQSGGSTGLQCVVSLAAAGPSVTVYTPTLSTGVWHHVAATWDGSTAKLYVDAVLQSSAALTGTMNATPTSLNVASWLGPSIHSVEPFWNGTASQLAAYAGALTLAQVQSHYASATATDQVGYDRPTFSYEVDATQLSNDVTVRGGTYVSTTHTQTWVGNANQASFPFDYPPDTTTTAGGSIPTVTVGGTGQTVALDTGSGFGSHQALVSVAQNSQSATLLLASAPGNGVVVQSTYVYDLPVLIERKNQASVNIFGRYQEYIADSNIKTQQAATQRASGEIAEFGWPIARIHADLDYTYVGALAAGQSVLVTCAQYGLSQVAMIVDTCRIRGIGGGYYQHQVDLVGLAPMGPPTVYDYDAASSLYNFAQYQ